MSTIVKCNDCKALFLDILDENKCPGTLKPLKPNTSDGAAEKHVPDVKIDGKNVHVQIGDVEHPMVEEHYIMFIYLETDKGGQLKLLKPDEHPSATFVLTEDARPIAVYEYCNIHGLWKKDL